MRTKGASHHETRQDILDAARRMIIRDGHTALSLRAVARETGFSAPSLYEYFDSKQAIVDAVAAQVAGKLRAALERAGKEARGARAAVVALGIAYVAWARRHPQDFLLLFTRLGSKRRSLDQAAPPESPYQVVLAVVTAAREAGVLAGDPETVAYALWAAAHGMAMLQLTHLAGFGADFEAADRAALAALIAGFAPS